MQLKPTLKCMYLKLDRFDSNCQKCQVMFDSNLINSINKSNQFTNVIKPPKRVELNLTKIRAAKALKGWNRIM